MEIANFVEKNIFEKSQWVILLKYKNYDIYDENDIGQSARIIDAIHANFLSTKTEPKNIMDLFEMCKKTMCTSDLIYLAKIIINCLRDLTSNSKSMNLWIDAINDVSCISGTSSDFVVGKINKHLTTYKYNDCSKVIETYLRFYFYFFNPEHPNQSSCKIYKLLEKCTSEKQLDELLSVLAINQQNHMRECKIQLELFDKNKIINIALQIKKLQQDVCYELIDTDTGNKFGSGISSSCEWAMIDAQRQISNRLDVDKNHVLTINNV